MAFIYDEKLCEILVQQGVLTRDQKDAAIAIQSSGGASLSTVLIENGFTDEFTLASKLGGALNVPFMALSQYEIEPSVILSIPEDIVRKYRIIPVDNTNNELTVALPDPSNIYLLDDLMKITKCTISPVIAFESDIQSAIDTFLVKDKDDFEGNALQEISESALDFEGLELTEDQVADEIEAVNDLAAQPDDAPVVTMVNRIIEDAVRMRASDIHIEPYEKDVRLRYRVDGHCQEVKSPPKSFQNAIISRLKIISGLDIAERRVPQDGRFSANYQGKKIDFRISTCPTVFGEKVVIRLLDSSNLSLSIQQLGMSALVESKFRRNIFAPWGMILVTGPTGSGKSTTLYTALSAINDSAKNIMTAEDPVEYQVTGINQVLVRPQVGLTFASALKSFLRQDPDIIMVGEIRDLETAEIAVKAAMTGHLVMSTLHTNDAPSTVNRLINMGIEPFLITASLNLIVAQRLARRICQKCRTEGNYTVEQLRSVYLSENEPAYIGMGCDACNFKGFKGRVALYELLELSDEIREVILSGASTTLIKKQAINEGMMTLRMAGGEKIKAGTTTIDEVLAVTIADER